jgi:hypothetical protein
VRDAFDAGISSSSSSDSEGEAVYSAISGQKIRMQRDRTAADDAADAARDRLRDMYNKLI